MFILGCTQKECQIRKEILWIITEVSSNQGFLLGLQKNNQKQKPRRNLMKKRYLHGPMIWKVMQRNEWKDIASLRTQQRSNYTKSRRHALTTTNSRKKTWDLLENCQTFAHRLFCNASIWLELVDLIFYGLWTKLARAVTKWTKGLARLISYIHHTCEWPGMRSIGGCGLVRVPNLRVCKHRCWGVAHASKRINVLPWYRQVAVAKTSSETQRRKNRAVRKDKWSPRGTGMTVLTYPGMRPCNRQGWCKRSVFRWDGRQLTLDKTVGSRVWWHTEGSGKQRLV